MARHPLTVEDLWRLPRVGAPTPSPDGSRVLVPVTTYPQDGNEGVTRIWLVPGDATGAGAKEGRDGDPARPLTPAESSAGQPAWSPDGRRVVFVRKPGGVKDEKKKHLPRYTDKGQLHLLSLDGGEAERLTDFPLGVMDPLWFPDGKRIAFVASVYADAPDPEESAKRAKEKEEDPVKASVTEDRVYRYWDHWLTDGTVHHIFVLDLETREVMDLIPDSNRLFDQDDPCGQYRIAPDGKEIAFSACRTDPPHDPWLWGVFTVPVPGRTQARAKGGKVTEIKMPDAAHLQRPVYTPDGDAIIFGLQREWDFYADKVRLVAYDRGKGKSEVLTEAWDFSAGGWNFGPDGRWLYLEAEAEARTAFFALDLKEARKRPGQVLPEEIARGGTLTEPRPAGGFLFANRSTLTGPPEIVAYRLGGRGGRGGSARAGADAGLESRMVTAFTAPLMKDIEISQVTEEYFTGAGGDTVQMYLLYPPGQKPEKARKGSSKAAARGAKSQGGAAERIISGPRYPLVHMVHGGPHGTFPDQWHWRWNAQAFAAPGYLVALVNFHGSTGWGQAFTASILGRWGDQPYDDVMAATDDLIDRGLVDRKRMAVTGGSYGGYLVSWIATQTDRFACIINHAGVCDFQTQYASDVTQGRPRSLGGEPWDNIEGMDRYNPLRHAQGFHSPMLVIHGEKDYRVPYNQGLEIYNVYKAMKLPARLVYYPDENHWILKPRNSKHWYGEVMGWLGRWIGTGR